jgi:hypothetical protein
VMTSILAVGAIGTLLLSPMLFAHGINYSIHPEFTVLIKIM